MAELTPAQGAASPRFARCMQPLCGERPRLGPRPRPPAGCDPRPPSRLAASRSPVSRPDSQDKSENEQVAYFRRLYASYQQQYSRERAKRDRAVFACIDQYRSVSLPGRARSARGVDADLTAPPFCDPWPAAAVSPGCREGWRLASPELEPVPCVGAAMRPCAHRCRCWGDEAPATCGSQSRLIAALTKSDRTAPPRRFAPPRARPAPPPQYILTHYKPMHPELRELRDGFFDETFLGALRDPSPEAWASIATQVHPGVYTFRLLNEAWCKRLLEEVDHFEMWSKEVSLHVNRPNSMNVSPAPWPSSPSPPPAAQRHVRSSVSRRTPVRAAWGPGGGRRGGEGCHCRACVMSA